MDWSCCCSCRVLFEPCSVSSALGDSSPSWCPATAAVAVFALASSNAFICCLVLYRCISVRYRCYIFVKNATISKTRADRAVEFDDRSKQTTNSQTKSTDGYSIGQGNHSIHWLICMHAHVCATHSVSFGLLFVVCLPIRSFLSPPFTEMKGNFMKGNARILSLQCPTGCC